jgi:ABC-type multidrug transport system fused ATPase/permease subunit
MTQTGIYNRFATSSVSMQTAATSWLGFDLPDANERPLFYVGVYGLIGLAFALGNLFSTIAQVVGTLRASRLLFKKLLNVVVHATIRWHDTTPQGRMLNRFSKDIETIDSSLAGSIEAVNSSLANFFASIITVG